MPSISRRAMLASVFAAQDGVRRVNGAYVGQTQPGPMLGFREMAVPPGGEVGLHWQGVRGRLRGEATLRVAVAKDDREARPLRVVLARTGRELGAFDIRYGCEFQPFDLRLDARATQEAQAEGVKLVSGGGEKPLWILIPPEGRALGLAPQLWQAGTKMPEQEFVERMGSLDSLQQLTWMEGCVLEGLRDLGLEGPWREHLEFWFGEKGSYERMFGVEATLPAASLARWKPEHPAVARTISYWRKMTREDKTIGHGDSTVAECNYTVSYPMAVLSKQIEDEWLAEQAIRQLRAARNRLVHDGKLWLRHYTGDRRTYPNWCRGVCWYSLGMARTLVELKSRTDAEDLKKELARVLSFARGFQRPDGLYSCFLDQAEIAPDASGSAGIAAAMAIAVNHGLVAPEFLDSARATWKGLVNKLTGDGFLTGVSQSNKREAGEALQRSDYRVTLQFGMGLMAQLKAALDGPVKRV